MECGRGREMNKDEKSSLGTSDERYFLVFAIMRKMLRNKLSVLYRLQGYYKVEGYVCIPIPI